MKGFATAQASDLLGDQRPENHLGASLRNVLTKILRAPQRERFHLEFYWRCTPAGLAMMLPNVFPKIARILNPLHLLHVRQGGGALLSEFFPYLELCLPRIEFCFERRHKWTFGSRACQLILIDLVAKTYAIRHADSCFFRRG